MRKKLTALIAGAVIIAAADFFVYCGLHTDASAIEDERNELSIYAQINDSGHLTVTPTLTCKYGDFEHPPKARLIIAVYDEKGTLAADISTQEVILVKDIVETKPVVFDDLECGAFERYNVKAFLWESLDGMKPSTLNVMGETEFPNIQCRDFRTVIDGNNNRYIMFTDDGTNSFTYNFANTSFPLGIEFDIKINEIKGAGDVFGTALFSGETEVAGFGLYKNRIDGSLLPHESDFMNYLYTNEGYDESSYYENQWLHVTVGITNEYNEAYGMSIEHIRVSISDETGGTVYVPEQDITCKARGLPVNCLVFGLVYDSGNNTESSAGVCLRNLKLKTS